MALIDDWNSFRTRPYPTSVDGPDTGGVELLLVDSTAAGYVDSYFEHGQLEPARLGVLEQCVRDLDRVLPALSGEPAAYFRQLAALCRGVLQLAAEE